MKIEAEILRFAVLLLSSLTIRRVESALLVESGLFVKGQPHRAASNILIASKQTLIKKINDRHNAKSHT
jgi:hypothetical protein